MKELTICSVILQAKMDIPMPIIIILALIGLVGLPLLIRFIEKTTGTTTVVVNKMANRQASLQRARRGNAEYERQLMEKMKKMSPDIIKQAQNNIVNSIYANTIQNVYNEAVKLERIKKVKETSKLISNKLSNTFSQVINAEQDKEKSDFEIVVSLEEFCRLKGIKASELNVLKTKAGTILLGVGDEAIATISKKLQGADATETVKNIASVNLCFGMPHAGALDQSGRSALPCAMESTSQWEVVNLGF